MGQPCGWAAGRGQPQRGALRPSNPTDGGAWCGARPDSTPRKRTARLFHLLRLESRKGFGVGIDPDGGGEFERVLAAAWVRHLDEISRPAFLGFGAVRDVDAGLALFDVRAFVGRPEGFQSEIAVLGVHRLPEFHCRWLVLAVDADVAGRQKVPGEARARGAAEEGLVVGQHALSGIGILQAVVGVGDVAEVLLAAKVVEVVAGRIGKEELVAGRVNHELRHGQAVAIAVGLFDLFARRWSPCANNALSIWNLATLPPN